MNLKNDHDAFRGEITKRNIQYLVHFTRFESITAIVGEEAIMPRNQLHNIAYEWQELISPNSQTRYDDPGDINTSIMHPNVYLLNYFASRKPGYFCIVGIDPKYIYETGTRFSISNATYQAAIRYGIDGTISKFQTLFAQNIVMPNKHTRQVTTRVKTLPNFYTTDPQAEVLICSKIPYGDFKFIAFQNQFEHDLLASAFDVLGLPTEKFCVQPILFKLRQ
jgi:hypothetical protein